MDRRVGWAAMAVVGLALIGAGVASAFWMSQSPPDEELLARMQVAQAAGRSAGQPAAPGSASPSAPDAGAPSNPNTTASAPGTAAGTPGADGADAMKGIEQALRELEIDGVTATSLGRRCDPRPCVLGIRLIGPDAELEAARSELFMAGLKVDGKEGQVTWDWSEGTGGMTGFTWLVPNDLTLETSTAMDDVVALHKRALGPGGL